MINLFSNFILFLNISTIYSNYSLILLKTFWIHFKMFWSYCFLPKQYKNIYKPKYYFSIQISEKLPLTQERNNQQTHYTPSIHFDSHTWNSRRFHSSRRPPKKNNRTDRNLSLFFFSLPVVIPTTRLSGLLFQKQQENSSSRLPIRPITRPFVQQPPPPILKQSNKGPEFRETMASLLPRQRYFVLLFVPSVAFWALVAEKCWGLETRDFGRFCFGVG